VLVVDASAVLEGLKGSPQGIRFQDRLLDRAQRLQAPHLIDLEVVQTLRRWHVQAGLSDDAAARMLAVYRLIPIRRYGHADFLPRAWELREHATAYDAVYIALAEALDVPLLTADRRWASAHWHHARVEVL
jgi:predicted nucleic acid-binding protein